MNVTETQVYWVVGKYLDNHPEEWAYSADQEVFLAISDAFPPKKK
jgi:hypothetical protein